MSIDQIKVTYNKLLAMATRRNITVNVANLNGEGVVLNGFFADSRALGFSGCLRMFFLGDHLTVFCQAKV